MPLRRPMHHIAARICVAVVVVAEGCKVRRVDRERTGLAGSPYTEASLVHCFDLEMPEHYMDSGSRIMVVGRSLAVQKEAVAVEAAIVVAEPFALKCGLCQSDQLHPPNH